MKPDNVARHLVLRISATAGNQRTLLILIPNRKGRNKLVHAVAAHVSWNDVYVNVLCSEGFTPRCAAAAAVSRGSASANVSAWLTAPGEGR